MQVNSIIIQLLTFIHVLIAIKIHTVYSCIYVYFSKILWIKLLVPQKVRKQNKILP